MVIAMTSLAKIIVPPIKSQGIKTKLVPWIKTIVPGDFNGVWLEPFMGTGVVAFNSAPKHAILCDTNPHLINFYSSIQSGKITPSLVKEYLAYEGHHLLSKGEEHYYAVRNRFNQHHEPLDFLFVNRSGFNGMIRFNGKGGFNIPFCRKPARFAQAYITKIVNQVASVSKILQTKDFVFKCQSFEETIKLANDGDIIYCDPPYIDRHVDYYNGWSSKNEHDLFDALDSVSAKFILSTWHNNDFRTNDYISSLWNRFNLMTKEHFYHVGGSEENRNPMIEALVTNFLPIALAEPVTHKRQIIFPELLTA
jgi:DNA adenine methylase